VLRALEHHVLEQVREPGAPGIFVGWSHVVPQVHGHHGEAALLAQDHLEAVRQRVLLELEARHVGGRRLVLRGRGDEARHDQDEGERQANGSSLIHNLVCC
jgi:hypothetical protein